MKKIEAVIKPFKIEVVVAKDLLFAAVKAIIQAGGI